MNSQVVASYNVALKRALLETCDAKGRPLKQKTAAKRTHIEITRFSKIINGRAIPTNTERRRLSKLVQRPESELFPDDEFFQHPTEMVQA